MSLHNDMSIYRPTRVIPVYVAGCRISITDLEENSPLILKTVFKRGETSFHMPNTLGSNLLTFRSGESIKFACPDANVNKLQISNSDFVQSDITAFCKKGKTFSCFQCKKKYLCIVLF